MTITTAALTSLSLAAAQSSDLALQQGAPADVSGKRPDRDELRFRGRGFVRDAAGDIATIDVPGASAYTLTLSADERGRTVGSYVDARGRTHGFVRNRSGDFIRIDFPGAGLTFATRINSRGQIVGVYDDDPNAIALDATHGFLLDRGRFTKIDVPGAVATRAFGINNHGQIVGGYVDALGFSHGFLLNDGAFTTLDAPDATSTAAADIDDDGRIVGTSFAGGGAIVRGFLRDPHGAFTPIDAPAAPPPPGRPELPQTQVFGLNNRGQIAGVVADSQGVRAFLLDDGVFTTVQVPKARTGRTVGFDVDDEGRVIGAYDFVAHGVLRNPHGAFITIEHPEGFGETVLTGINNRGQLTVFILDASGTGRGFLRDKGCYIEIEVPGALQSGPGAINERGQIVGAYSTLTNLNHAFPVRGYLWERGAVTLIDVPDAIFTTIQGINDRGQMVGEYLDDEGRFHGYQRDERGVITTIDASGGTHGTSLLSINNRGAIVGFYFNDTGAHGFVFSNGRFSAVGFPGSFTLAAPFDIDDRGRIVGAFL